MRSSKFVLSSKSFVIMIGLSATLTGCNASKVGQEFLNGGVLDGIFSTRPQASEPVITMIKLQTPALMQTAVRKDGHLEIDKKLLAAIEAEQTATVDALAKISPEIKVIIRYKLVLNALTIVAPPDLVEKVKALSNVVMSEQAGSFGRPQALNPEIAPNVGVNTSVKFIGAEAAYAAGIHGEGMKVGVIDTGVDYTHKMFLGQGTEQAYKDIDPAKATPAFPNKKVVGGIDLVGTNYNTASPVFADRLPVPDANPIDEAEHGTHVAGSIAGIGDGINTYSGVAPAADIYAIKVFGAKGSTSDIVVIQALEYALNPSGDLKFDDQLDVVNLSLGSSFGTPHIMYNEAIKNLVRAGTVAVISAGNEGDKSYVVGAPGVSDDAISVASSVDNQNQNIHYNAAEFQFGGETIKVEAIEGGTTKPLADFTEFKGELIAVGIADKDFDQDMADKIKGKVALIDRGAVSFLDKIKRAQAAGAIAVVMANNQAGAPIIMGGDEKVPFLIPGVMIDQVTGNLIKEKMALGAVTVDLKPAGFIDKSFLIDTISTFSSRGPRSEDGLIKPEIAAPGTNIVSAGRGTGDKGLQMSGTSMAGPHIAGVMALLKQKFNKLEALELKSVLMGHAKLIADADKKIYTVSRQGAGRVQIAESLKAEVVSLPAALSFGITDIEKQKTMVKELTLKNIGTEPLVLKAEWTGSKALLFSVKDVSLAAGESKKILISVKVSASAMANANDELDGYLRFNTEKGLALQIPALVVARQISQIKANSLLVHSTSAADSAGSLVDLVLQNAGINAGQAFLFNLLDVDGRKKDSRPDASHDRNCDMQSAGYRVIERDGTQFLQVAVKLYEGVTTWNSCELNVQIDSDGDGLADQEIAGVPMSSLPGLSGDDFVSLLLDGNKARAIRKQYEADVKAKVDDVKENYTAAVVDKQNMTTFDNSTLAIVEADISELGIADTGELNIKVATTHQDSGAIEYDDYLGKQEKEWAKISLSSMAQSYILLPEVVELKGQETQTVSFQKGYGASNLIVYVPQNKSVVDVLLNDLQSQIVEATYGE